jgi:hypothetical protein
MASRNRQNNFWNPAMRIEVPDAVEDNVTANPNADQSGAGGMLLNTLVPGQPQPAAGTPQLKTPGSGKTKLIPIDPSTIPPMALNPEAQSH